MGDIYKTYDIRGIYPKELDKKFAFEFGRASAIFFKQKEILVARDGRTSSNSLKEELMKGLATEESKIIDLGIISTPAAYFALIKLKKPLIIITASHNPKEYNGFKVVDDNFQAIDKAHGLLEIKEIQENLQTKQPKQPEIKNYDIKSEYFAFLDSLVYRIDHKIPIVLDQSNGSARLESVFLQSKFNNIKIINQEVDGNFPGHSPDPSPEKNREQLKQEMIKQKAKIGFIFDGDADRVMVLDDKLKFIRPEIIASLLIDKGLALYDVRASHYLKHKCAQKNIKSKMIPTGRSIFAKKMNELNADIGVEGSGHYFFKEFKGLDSAIITILKLLEKISDEKKPLSELVKDKTKFMHSNEINYKVKDATKTIQEIKNNYKDKKIIELDGLTVELDENSWFNIRKSNTEPLIRLNAETNSEEKTATLVKELEKIIFS